MLTLSNGLSFRIVRRKLFEMESVKTIHGQRKNLSFIVPNASRKYIATHDGVFHCDEVTACFMLKQLPSFKNHDIVRTRNKILLESADIILDVGGVFDEKKRRFDHHQRTFHLTIKDFHPSIKSTNPERPIRLSSAGLIYAHFGRDLIKEILNIKSTGLLEEEDRDKLNAIYDQFYFTFMEEIDAIDNGVEMVEGDNVIYNYNLSTHLAARIRQLNPHDATPEERMKQFHLAMSVAGRELIDSVNLLNTSWWPSLEKMRKCVMNRHILDESGAIVQVPTETAWKTTIFHVEEQLSIVGQIKYVLLNNRYDDNKWRLVAVPKSPKSNVSRLPLREDWRGLQGEELCKKSGVPNAIFVHASGFIGGATSREGCLDLARKTISASGSQ